MDRYDAGRCRVRNRSVVSRATLCGRERTPYSGGRVDGRPRKVASHWPNRVGLALLIGCAGFSAIGGKPGSYPIAAVPFTRVRLTDTFWAPRLEINRTVTIPFGFAKIEQEGRVRNFERAAHKRAGAYEGKMPFDDTDVSTARPRSTSPADRS